MAITDIEIAQNAVLQDIVKIADKLGLKDDDIECYGKYKAKIMPVESDRQGKLVLVTAINPTAAGEGKTTVSVGLADGMSKLGKKAVLALREPSLGPVFGIKGGAAGGGYAQIAPMSDINMHFTGDMHAITSACNLLAAMIDNHLFNGNILKIKTVNWRRCMDMNDRSLRSIVIGLGGATGGVPREDTFTITAASEIMAVLCLAQDMNDLKERLGNIIIGTDIEGREVTARQIKATEAMAILLKDALKPNLVQTLEGTPALVHGGPFANIAHGCNSVIATKTALSLADYVVTEAGFGADLGAEKFLNIKCRVSGLSPSCVVIVATVRALKSSGGVSKADLGVENVDALIKGLDNLAKHIENIKDNFGLECVVAINRFVGDTNAEMSAIMDMCKNLGVRAIDCDVWSKGGDGAIELANVVAEIADNVQNSINHTYELDQDLRDKINAVATKIYGADGVDFAPKAAKEIDRIQNLGYGNLPICIAKTQYSLSDNPTLLGRPKGFRIQVRDIQLRAGAGFVVVVAGDIMLMPGLPRVPNAENMEIDDTGAIKGLF